jgi:6,7-dimethyl-8-ribityllumazine synthase
MDGGVVASKGMKFGVVVGRFNDLVTKLLLEGALEAFERHGATLDDVQVGALQGPCTAVRRTASGAAGPAGPARRQPSSRQAPAPAPAPAPAARTALPPSPLGCAQVAWAPGCFELPVVAKAMAKSGAFDAVICIGVVVGAGSRRAPAMLPAMPATAAASAGRLLGC